MNFLAAVNRILRINNIIRGDDDDLSNFSETQHAASLNLAIIAVQTELNQLAANRFIPYEETTGNVTYATDTRLYSLPSDFIRFKGRKPFLLEVDSNDISENKFVVMIDEETLRRQVLDYKSHSGQPVYFYIVGGTSNQIGLWPVPTSEENGQKTEFPYEKDVTVSSESDDLPFRNDMQGQIFADMAARRFYYLYEEVPVEQLGGDVIWMQARSALAEAITLYNHPTRCGTRYV